MLLLKSFFKRIAKDFQQKELLPLKLVFFIQSSTLFVLYPYLTIHMRELGINVEETAIMSAVTPIVGILMPPIAGLMADRIGNFKFLLALFSTLGGAASLLLLLVPIGRYTVQFPNQLVVDISCPSNNSELIYTISQNFTCDIKLQPEIATTIETCGIVCNADMENKTDLEQMLNSKTYTFSHYNPTNDKKGFIVFKNSRTKKMPNAEDVQELRKLMNDENFGTSIRRLSNNMYFFPTKSFYEFACTDSRLSSNDSSPGLAGDEGSDIVNLQTMCIFKEFFQHTKDIYEQHMYQSKLKMIDPSDRDLVENRRRFSVEEMSIDGKKFNDLVCKNPDTESEQVSVTIPVASNTNISQPDRQIFLGSCSPRCIATVSRKDICTNSEMVIENNVQLTFWMYLVIRVFIGIIGGTSYAMLEGAAIAILREQKADYGLQRIYGSIGGMISSPLSGLLIDYASIGKGYTDFRPAFYLYAALKLVAGIMMLWINLEFKAPAHNILKDVVSVLKNIELVALLIACFVLGTAWGYIEAFLFWLIQDLGGSRSLMGITITIGGIAGIPLLVLSGPIISKIGHANVLFIGFVFYAIRLLGYSLIYNPWLCLVFEAMESVTTSLSFTAAVTYAARLSTTSTDSSIQGLLGGIYYGVGKGSGSLIGGYLMKFFDTRPTYQIFSAFTLATGIMYFLFNMTYLRKRPQVEGNDIVKKKPKTERLNGLENGTEEMNLAEQKKKKKKKKNQEEEKRKTARGSDNAGFARDDSHENLENLSKNMEAINNARNLDKIEKVPDEEKFPKKRSSKSEKKSVESEDQNNLRKRSSVQNGTTNPVFEGDFEGKCNVIIENEPSGLKTQH